MLKKIDKYKTAIFFTLKLRNRDHFRARVHVLSGFTRKTLRTAVIILILVFY